MWIIGMESGRVDLIGRKSVDGIEVLEETRTGSTHVGETDAKIVDYH
jgi:hypothetical protein